MMKVNAMTFPRTSTRFFPVALLALAALAAAACGDDAAVSAAPDAGTKDAGAIADALGGGICEAEQVCDFTCSEGCNAQCLGSHCTAECDKGGCSLDADLDAVAAFDCAGGGCTTDCDGASTCSVGCSGGGCQIGCDGDSTCKVSCGEKGKPCKVTCEAGSIASCDNDNCEFTGCDACDRTMIDESYMPSLDAANYSTVIDNPLYPLPVDGKWVFESDEEVITITVMKATYMTAAGVECLVVHDQAKNKAGEVIEDTNDYFAQDADGNVWYFGEDTAEYVNGKVANTLGSWEAGKDGALPGIVMHAKTPEIGTKYKQEYYRCEAEDMAEILSVGESVKVAAGDYKDCVQVRDYTPLDPRGDEHKFYCPGVGLVRVDEVPSGETDFVPVERLKSIDLP
jgi:hypothetical protein